MSARTPRRNRVTLRDVAARAGVHPGTASRALNARDLVSAKTAQRIRDAAAELGYRPNRIARGLKTDRSYTVGVLIPDLTNPLFPPIVRGIQDRLEEASYTPLIANTDNDPDREVADFEAMRGRQVDGFIAATARSEHWILDELRNIDRPIVLVNRRLDAGGPPAVSVDDHAGARLATEHLIGLGHSRIAHLAGPQDLSTGHERREGFIAALRAAGRQLDDRLVPVASAFIESEGERLCEALLAVANRPTAIVAGNDLMALGCYDVLEARGIHCPQEISVVGFNDMPFADRFSPPMTTIRIPHYETGLRAAELLLALLAHPGRELDQPRVSLEPELIVRGSTAPPRGDSQPER